MQRAALNTLLKFRPVKCVSSPVYRGLASGHDDGQNKVSEIYGKHPDRLDKQWQFDHRIDEGSEGNVPENYRPGGDLFDYDNPWPKLNKGRLDWLFDDGWRRPPKTEEGGYVRKQHLTYHIWPDNPHADWYWWHGIFGFIGFAFFTPGILYLFGMSNQVKNEDWNATEAYFELERRTNAGLDAISPDLLPRSRVEKQLPSDDELGDFRIII